MARDTEALMRRERPDRDPGPRQEAPQPAGNKEAAGHRRWWRGRSVAAGVTGSVVASLCCLPAAAGIGLGLSLGTVATLSQLLAYQRFFQVGGFAFAGLVVWKMLSRRGSACSLSVRERERVTLLVLGSFAVGFAVLNVLLIPLLERAA